MKRAVGYITTKGLVVYPSKGEEHSILFPDTYIQEGKISDRDGLIKYLTNELLAHVDKEKEIVIVVGNGILFQYAYSPDVTDREERRKEFEKHITIEKSVWLEKTIETQSKNYELVTHKDYVDIVATACDQAGLSVVGFIPLSLFTDDAAQDVLPSAAVEEIRKSADLYEATSFDYSVTHTVEEEKPVEEKQPMQAFAPASSEFVIKQKKTSSGNLFFILALVGIIAISAIGGFFLLQSTLGQSEKKVEEVTPTATPTPTPVPTVAKDEITIQILNGTGTAGQAGKVEALLEDAGFSNIETGNAESSDNEDTIVVFSSQVGEKEQKEIISLLEEEFESVKKETSEDEDTLVVITTGTEIE